MTIRRYLLAAAGLAAAGTLTLSACTSTSGTGTPAPTTSSAAPTTSSPTPTTAVPTTPTPTPASTSASASDSATDTTTSSAPTSTAPTQPAGTDCVLPGLGVSVERGGAALGREVAIVTLTNNSDASCQLSGYSGAVLERAGSPLGNPAENARANIAVVTLKPGDTAQETLNVATDCQAKLSDHVRITPPGGGSVDAPLVLRGCAMTIGPIGR